MNVDAPGEWLFIHKYNKIIKPNDCPQFLLDCTTLLNAMMPTYRGYSGLPNATFATLKRTSDGN
jgi:hypothetical protein